MKMTTNTNMMTIQIIRAQMQQLNGTLQINDDDDNGGDCQADENDCNGNDGGDNVDDHKDDDTDGVDDDDGDDEHDNDDRLGDGDINCGGVSMIR